MRIHVKYWLSRIRSTVSNKGTRAWLFHTQFTYLQCFFRFWRVSVTVPWPFSTFRSKALLRSDSIVPRRSWPYTVPDRSLFLTVPDRFWAFPSVFFRLWAFTIVLWPFKDCFNHYLTLIVFNFKSLYRLYAYFDISF